MNTRDRLRQAVMALPLTPCLPLGERAGAVELLLPVVEQIAAERAAEELLAAADGDGLISSQYEKTIPVANLRARAAGLTDRDGQR